MNFTGGPTTSTGAQVDCYKCQAQAELQVSKQHVTDDTCENKLGECLTSALQDREDDSEKKPNGSNKIMVLSHGRFQPMQTTTSDHDWQAM